MARPTTAGKGVLGPKTVGAFFLGVGIGLVLVAPVLPAAVGDRLAGLLTGGGSVVLAGMGAFAAILVLLAVSYQLYLQT